MPFLRKTAGKHDEPRAGEGPAAPYGPVLQEGAVRRVLGDELARVHRYGRPLSVLRILGYLLPHEKLHPAEHALVRETLAAQLRNTDHVGVMSDGSYLAVLPETPEPAAEAVAQRVAAELSLRSASLNKRTWLVGVVACTREHDVDSVLVQALAAAMRSRMHGWRAA